MFKLRPAIFGVLAIACLLGAPLNAATLNGATMSAVYLYPDSSTTYPNATPTGPFVVGAGVEGVISVENVTNIGLDFSGSQLLVNMATVLANPVWNDVGFNGFKVSLLSLGLTITDFALVRSTFGPITTSFTATDLFVSWSGAAYHDGDTAVFSIGVSAVPLPAGLPLLLAGLGGLALVARRKSRA